MCVALYNTVCIFLFSQDKNKPHARLQTFVYSWACPQGRKKVLLSVFKNCLHKNKKKPSNFLSPQEEYQDLTNSSGRSLTFKVADDDYSTSNTIQKYLN